MPSIQWTLFVSDDFVFTLCDFEHQVNTVKALKTHLHPTSSRSLLTVAAGWIESLNSPRAVERTNESEAFVHVTKTQQQQPHLRFTAGTFKLDASNYFLEQTNDDAKLQAVITWHHLIVLWNHPPFPNFVSVALIWIDFTHSRTSTNGCLHHLHINVNRQKHVHRPATHMSNKVQSLSLKLTDVWGGLPCCFSYRMLKFALIDTLESVFNNKRCTKSCKFHN